MPPRGSRRVLESSRKASYCHRGVARKHNYTLLVSLCPAAKRHGSRIKEMCLTVSNILGYSIASCRNYFNQIYRIFDSGQTHCHSGLLKGLIRSSLWPLTNLCMTAIWMFFPSQSHGGNLLKLFCETTYSLYTKFWISVCVIKDIPFGCAEEFSP